MSIINDALKKVQISLKKKEPPVQEKQPIPNTPASEATSSVQPQIRKESSPQPSLPPPPFLLKDSLLKKDYIQNILLVLFCLAMSCLFFALAAFLLKQVTKPKATSVVPEVVSEKPAALKQQKIMPQKQREQPPAPALVIEKDPLEGITVYGIMTMDDKYVALINNEIYEVGDKIDGMKIMDIALDHVKFLIGKQIRTLEVNK